MLFSLNQPLLELLLLSVIKREDSYGYQISQQLKGVSDMKDSSLYPVLKRLSESGFVEAYDQQFQGRNRKYYRLTDSGSRQYTFLGQEWESYIQAIKSIIEVNDGTKTGVNGYE